MKHLFHIIIAVTVCLTVFMPVYSSAYISGCGNDDPPPCDEPEPNEPPPPDGGGSEDPPPDNPPDPVCPDGSSEGTSSINPYRANKRRHVTDLQTYGAEPIFFRRIYNSRTTDFTTNAMDFGWKQTWQHNWNFEVREMTTSTLGKKDIRVRYPSGTDLKFGAVETDPVVVRASHAFHGDRLYEWTGDVKGQTLVTPGGWEYDFQWIRSPRYKLVQVRDGHGSVWTVSHDAQDRVARIENNFGRWIEISRTNLNGTACIDRVASSDGLEVLYEYDTWAYPLAETEQVVADAVLSAVHYPDGAQATYTYVGAESLTNGRPLLATADDPMHPGAGARVKFNYNYNAVYNFGAGPYLVTGVILEERSLDTDELVVSLPTGAGDHPQVLRGGDIEVTYIYTNGVLREKRDGEGRPTLYTRDANGFGYVTGITDGASNTTTFVRDYAGRALERIDALGHTNSFTYNDKGGLTSQTAPLGHTTLYTRDASNRLTRIDYPDGSFEAWTYNEYGQFLTRRLRNGGVKTFEYFGENDPDGHAGDLKRVTDPESNVVTYAWAPDNHITVTDPAGNDTRLAYDWRWQLCSITNADGTSTAYQYDAYGNKVKSIDEAGRETLFTYDAFNRLQTIRDPLNRTTTFEYGRAPGCGGCGIFENVISRIIDPAGKTTEYYYDRSSRKTNEITAAGTPEASSTAWTYDEVGRRSTQTDDNQNTHTWFYDAIGRVIAESNAMGEVTTYLYDPNGNQIQKTTADETTTWAQYNAMNKLTAYGSGNVEYAYQYDAGGRLSLAQKILDNEPVESASFSYNLNNQITQKEDAAGLVLDYEYNPLGKRSRLSISNVLEVAYAYDDEGRLTAITGNGKTTQFSYDPTGLRTNAVWPNGTQATYEYDNAGQLTALVHLAPDGQSILAAFEYEYDLSGNRITITDVNGTNTYAYDAHNWLVSAAYADGTAETFAYDGVGNRTSRLHTASGTVQQTAYTYGPVNRLLETVTQGETNSYTYDAVGRLIAQTVGEQERTYAYDFNSKMTSLTDVDDSVFAYEFDALGNRTAQHLNDCLTTRFVYDRNDAVVELNADGQIMNVYVLGEGIDQPIERISFVNGTPRLRHVFHVDALGSVAALTGEDGSVAQEYTYAAFGEIKDQTGTDMNRITYTAREAIGDALGFYYYRNRVMDPSTGRFTTEDPLGFIDGPNRYVYVRNNSMRFIDSWGLLLDELGAACKAAIEGLLTFINPYPMATLDPEMHGNLLFTAKCKAAQRAYTDCLSRISSGNSDGCEKEKQAMDEACGGATDTNGSK